MGDRVFKGELYGHFARIGKALSSPHRFEMLELLSQAPRTVDSLGKEIGLSLANTSSHLQVLKEARLVDAKKDGLFVEYRLSDETVVPLLQALRNVAEKRIADIDRLVQTYLSQREELEAVAFDELVARLKAGDVVLLDVRPPNEFGAGHIAGAISIPHDQLQRRLSELPKGKEIIAYCRGPYCVFADTAVKLLRSRRRKARRLVGGYPEWKAAGLPTAISA
jgi:rhodanese-related sulfurtransferase/DNA-binding transcriptional ArsR family regulator